MDHLFADLRVIDAASFLAAPGAATVMADFGADVIKVEPPQGDGYRTLVGNYPVDYNWQLTSRHKRSIALDLNRVEARAVLHQLIEDADVLLVNFLPGQLKRYELDYDSVRARNPRLIYAHMSAFGSAGPEAGKRGFDSTAWWARTGLMDLVRDPGQAPIMGAPGFGDHSSAMALFGAVMMGLYRRERTGEGCYVESSLAANGVWANGMQLQGMIAGFDLAERRQANGWLNPFTSVYRTRDQRYVLFAVINPGREWPQVCAALGQQDWLKDERFPDLRGVMKHRRVVQAMIQEQIDGLTLAELCARLDAHGITYSVVQRLQDVIDDVQLRENGIVVATESADASYPYTVGSPIQMREAPKKAPAAAPAIGEHTREVLKELGWNDDAIAQALAAGVVAAPRAEPDAD